MQPVHETYLNAIARGGIAVVIVENKLGSTYERLWPWHTLRHVEAVSQCDLAYLRVV